MWRDMLTNGLILLIYKHKKNQNICNKNTTKNIKICHNKTIKNIKICVIIIPPKTSKYT